MVPHPPILWSTLSSRSRSYLKNASINVTNEEWFYNSVLHGIKTPPQEAKITREIKTGIQGGLQHAQSPLRH